MRRASRAPGFLLAPAVLVTALVCGCGSAEKAAASPPQTGALEFVAEWGEKGDAPGQLAEPVAIAVDLNNRVYLADRGTGLLQKFESSGVPLLAYADPAMRSASALALDSGGAIYVADARNGRIWIHFPDGDPLRNFRVTPQRAAVNPFGFCVMADGKIVVPDPQGGRIQVYSPAGRLQSVWALPSPGGRRARPVATAAGLDEFIYIADAATDRIAKYTSRGVQEAIWDSPKDPGPLRGIAVSRDHVFALRGEKPRLEVWSFDGKLVLTDAFAGRFDSSPSVSLSFAVTNDEQVFVLDSSRAKVARFRLKLPSR